MSANGFTRRENKLLVLSNHNNPNQCLEVSRILHKEAVSAVAFSCDGKYLAIASADGAARLELWQSEDLINEASTRLTHNLTGDRIQ